LAAGAVKGGVRTGKQTGRVARRAKGVAGVAVGPIRAATGGDKPSAKIVLTTVGLLLFAIALLGTFVLRQIVRYGFRERLIR
jgi:hypothetical protein